MQSMFEIDDVYEQMTRQFENLMDEVNELMTDQTNTEEVLKKFLDSRRAERASITQPAKKNN
jgi:putative methionine-R-sulfoxide reductase with GAF domain